jgi:amino acid transporter
MIHAQFRGWGFSVLLLFAFWVWVLIALVVIISPYEPDQHRAALQVQWAFAAMFAAHALSVLGVAIYRRKRRRYGAIDKFMYLRLDVWPYILLAVSMLFAGATALGRELFS